MHRGSVASDPLFDKLCGPAHQNHFRVWNSAQCVQHCKANLAAKRLEIQDKIVVDAFCGTGVAFRAICVSIQPLGALRRMYGKSERMDGSRLSRGEEHLSLAQLFTTGVGPSRSYTVGPAGVIPAVLRYYQIFIPSADRKGMRDFLYTAAAIGFLHKERASLSAAEIGCRGEIGAACSMAAAGLAAVLGGTSLQIENAAEIGMEHSLGLTCDPLGGLVQIPCTERNTMGAIKAISAAHLAMHGNGEHPASLDAVIETMWQTGNDMSARYKEPALGDWPSTSRFSDKRENNH